MEQPIESQVQHMQTLNQPNPQNLGFLPDPNLQNPNYNPQNYDDDDDDDDDEMVEIISEELQSLVLKEAFNESRGDVEIGNYVLPVIESSGNGWGDDCYDDGDYYRSENVNGDEAVSKEWRLNENGDEAGWKGEGGFDGNGDEVGWNREGGFNGNGDEAGWNREGGFNGNGDEAGWKEGGFENGGEAGWRRDRGFNENGDGAGWKREGGFGGNGDEAGWRRDRGFNGNGDDAGWRREGFNENGDEERWKKGGFNENGDGAGWKGERGFNGNNTRRLNYPLRPDAEDCAYYMKTGICKFGLNCKFNHPSHRRNQQWTKQTEESEERTSEERAGQIECKYYLTAGGCKYGNACKYNHSKGKGISPVVDFNFLGLPVRPGDKECPYYMRTGSCKYGSNCRFHHPDPSTLTGGIPSSGYNNGGSAPVRSASYPTVSSWSSPKPLNETAPFVPVVYPASRGIPSPSPQWNGYQFQAPAYSTTEKSLPTPPAFTVRDPSTKTNFYPRHQQPWIVEEYPERPGQPDCSFFVKTGDCKYKSTCKFHHPKTQISKTNSIVLNDKGLPLRPDQAVCSFYSRYGICKFGPACKFDHPEHYDISDSSTVSMFDQPSFGNSATTDGTRMARKEVVL